MGWGGYGKGGWGGWGGYGGYGGWGMWMPPMYGKGKGKGKGRRSPKIDPSLKIWIGDIPAGTPWKDLQTLGNTAGKTKWVDVFKGKGAGTGVIAYNTAEEVSSAITQLSGATLNGAMIQVDRWEKAEKAEPVA
mmetsp:Transcript_87568/g.155310  ORF Transcript_87568/g.155310 Transcript_87568/m.155310 type:complete len:133 (+) Transcript_87568:60-458(+)|eukprot:CAMPEP_0197653284 /NCGR_PEP_ID=MMETSP1338-20131121/34960_1 /TAXON_ID=43686 ORGANISM="Pelagodinium beii, Strain RCC1491" /NCGR_SAMPLE_ID=MMETSP1338 /ASSEMBLY_ACC=CAM_ASM_000754 /LENGTH=132 /DNA_ID=CAMNT_0043228329 /DNA_START=52 /DNA_END=450 /DNA_ORIENTATION=+